jgi:PmbA protein
MAIDSPDVQGALDQARRAGWEAEVYVRVSSATTIKVQDGEIEQFTVADSRGAGFRVISRGRVGYAFTEDLTPPALERALEAAAGNAALVPAAGTSLAEFGGAAPELDLYRPDLSDIPIPEKIEKVRAVERLAKELDPRIKNVTGSAYSDSQGFVQVASTRGVDRRYRSSLAWISTVPLLAEGDQLKNYYQVRAGRDFARLDPEAIAREAVARAAEKLGASEPASGSYAVLLAPEAMADLLQVFCGIFSGKVAQEGKSLLRDRLGEPIASEFVTLVDDPLTIEGFGARPFDDEGCPSRTLTLVEKGTFRRFLHNSDTARKAGTESTGHASRAGYKGPLEVAPSNLFLRPGSERPEALVAPLREAILVSEVTGLHAGANAISGDFSLQAQGFLLHHGEKERPLHNFTVSGNFYTLLEAVTGVANDFEWFTSCIGAPSVLVRELAIAGS